ncbi:MAG: N-acetylneuraminate synthase family protein [Bdellovibrionales bacterium]|nr:N-acetylneuraminate synthase family protein [Bdellovibrionales bacterium]
MSIWKNKDLFIIAEIGGNHEGNFEYAKKLTHLACSSKAHTIKYQVYTGDTLVSPVESPDRNKHFKKFELSQDQFIELSNICRSYDKDFSVSVWNPDSVDWIDPLVTYYKIGSGDMNCYPVIDKFIAKKKPIVISTGLANEQEVIEVIQYIQNSDDFYKSPDNLAVLQCNSMYPTPDEDINLKTIRKYQELFPEVTVGYSDHSLDTLAAMTSIALGAKIIEVHFTDSREGKTFRDHLVSFTKDEIDQLYTDGLRIQKQLGSPLKQPTKSEIESGHVTSFRRAVYFNKDLPEGHTIQIEDLCFLRPCHGIPAKDWKKLIGKRIKHNTKAFTKISKDNLL